MGVTRFSLDLINKYSKPCDMLEYGAQNTYFTDKVDGKDVNLITGGNHYYWMKDYLVAKGYNHTSIDLNGLHGSIVKDLSYPIEVGQYDIVTDFGTSEHVTNLYHSFKNAFNACKVGGIVIHENPKTGHWQGHGHHYFTTDFYEELAKQSGYEILELGEVGAHGNTTTGMNVYCVLKKVNSRFPSESKFNSYSYYSK